MTKRLLGVGLLVATVGLGNLLDAAETGSLPVKMQQLRGVLEEILPIAVRRGPFENQDERDKFREALKDFNQMTHHLPEKQSLDPSKPTLDPSLVFIGRELASETKRALDQLRVGNERNAKRLVREITSYCIACHTTSQTGPMFSARATKKATRGMDEFEKAQFYTATRRFDAALDTYRRVVRNDKLAKERSIVWHDSVANALTIAVRYKRDPEVAGQIVQRALKQKNTAQFFRRDLSHWLESIEQWRKEKPVKSKTLADWIGRLTAMVNTAQRKQMYPADRAATVEFLRASAIGHEAIRSFPKSSRTSEVLYQLGVSYRALDDLGMWGLHNLYFEECVRLAPGQEIARRCYELYEQSVFENYSGSGGMHLPFEVEQKLKSLGKQSKSR